MMLRELPAFQACWLDLKDRYPTNREDNTLIAHALGQILDGYDRPASVEAALPDHLKILFRRLALAYFQGYFPAVAGDPNSGVVKPPVTPAAPWPGQSPCPDIAAAVAQVRVLAQQARLRMQQSSTGQTMAASEMDTLVIEFPDHW